MSAGSLVNRPTLPPIVTSIPLSSSARPCWRELVEHIGQEIAEPLSSALDWVDLMASGKTVSRPGLQALRNNLERAKHCAMVSQQIARLAAGIPRQVRERVNVSRTIDSVVAARAKDLGRRGLSVRRRLRPAQADVDPCLLYGLLDALLDWVVEHAESYLELGLESSGGRSVRLSCRFKHACVTSAAIGRREKDFDGSPVARGTAWQLIRHTAAAMHLKVVCGHDAVMTVLTLEFPTRIEEALPGLETMELDESHLAWLRAKPVAGSHVMVIAPRRDIRTQVRESIRHMSLSMDFARSVDEGNSLCQDLIPDAVIVEGSLRGPAFDRLRESLLNEAADTAFIEILDEGPTLEVAGFERGAMGRVGRDAIWTALPAALAFGLAREL